jgi:hypothetical protein
VTPRLHSTNKRPIIGRETLQPTPAILELHPSSRERWERELEKLIYAMLVTY